MYIDRLNQFPDSISYKHGDKHVFCYQTPET